MDDSRKRAEAWLGSKSATVDGLVAHLGRGIAVTPALRSVHAPDDRLTIAVQGGEGTLGEWRVALTFHPDTCKVDQIWVEGKQQEKGTGRTLLGNVAAACDFLGIARISITAVNAGSYFFARCRFTPIPASWNALRKRMASQLKAMGLPEELRKPVLEILGSTRPESIWELAEWPVMLPPDAEGAAPVSLARFLLSSGGNTWEGSLDTKSR